MSNLIMPTLDAESEQIREVYAMYGLAMYQAQCLERALAMVIAVLDSAKLTAWDYDARLAENFESTFGKIVTIFSEAAAGDHQDLIARLKSAADDRNKLAHRYFWDRAVTFCSAEGREGMLSELHALVKRFESLDGEVSKMVAGFMQERGLTEEFVQGCMEKLLSGTEQPHDPERVPNPVELVAAYDWQVTTGEGVKRKLIFVSENGRFLVLGEKGLCYGPRIIPEHELSPKLNFAKVLPATVNPRPKKAQPWNYTVRMANGYELRVRSEGCTGDVACRFGLYKD